jgi:predicted nuclease of predicted toxin-antitoxin system
MTLPRLLLDENLSPRLVKLLADVFPDSAHLDDVGLHGHTDENI